MAFIHNQSSTNSRLNIFQSQDLRARSSVIGSNEMSFHVLFFVSIVAGFVGAMSGMGGGVILIPVLTLFDESEMRL